MSYSTEARRRAALIVVLLATSVALAEAQSSSSTSSPRDTVQRKLSTLPNIAAVISPGLAATFEATADDKKGSAAVAVANSSETFTFSLTASGPLDKTTRETAPLSLEGLSSGAVLELGLNWFRWKNGTGSPSDAEAFCAQKTGKPECDRTDFRTSDDRTRYDELTGVDQNPWILSATASVGRTGFKYLTAEDLQSRSEQHNDAAFGFAIGQYAPRRGYISVGYEYQRAWEAAGGARQICLPLATSTAGSQECKSGTIGAPRLGRGHTATLQWRKFFRQGRVAVNPTVARDFEDSVTALTVPVYFFSDADGGLAGGTKLGWRSDTEAITFTVFVGTVLSILD